MSIDALLRKHLTGVVLVLLALAALFQAAGTVKLVEAAMLPNVSNPAVAPRTAPSVAPVTPKGSSAGPILARNIFDSTTGPLDLQPPAELTPPARADISDPLRSPRCTDITVSSVIQATDPAWSFAALKGPGDASSKLRRVGDQVGRSRVTFIGFNRHQGRPSVWLTEGPTLCQALLFAPAPPEPGAAPQAGSFSGGAPSLLAKIVSKIRKVTDAEYNLDRSVVDMVLDNQAELLRSVRVVPEKGADGRVVGIRLFGIRPDSLLGSLGMQNGDRLESINGFALGSPTEALEAYARLNRSPNLNLRLSRRGRPVGIELHVK
jgi:general secretion pathway protein C